MLAAIARALPAGDQRIAAPSYAGAHWLATFALYLRLGPDVV